MNDLTINHKKSHFIVLKSHNSQLLNNHVFLTVMSYCYVMTGFSALIADMSDEST